MKASMIRKPGFVGSMWLGVFAHSPETIAGNAFVTDYLNTSARADVAEELFDLSEDDLRTTPSIRLAAGEAFPDSLGVELSWRESFQRFSFNTEGPAFGDIAAGPFADGTSYKINAVNYDLYFGDDLKLPFQLYFGDISSSESPEDTNEAELQDATQGLAIQFPIAWRFYGRRIGGLCSFKRFDGYCVAGGDVTIRSVRLNGVTETGAIEQKYIFGTSAALKASILFPLFPGGNTADQAGKLGMAAAIRHLWHDSENNDLLFGNPTDPQGTPVRFDGDFSMFSFESELEIYGNLKIRLEYFRPLSDDKTLDDVFAVSFVVAGQKPN